MRRFSGSMKRTPREEAALRVRLLDGLHTADIIERARAEMGTRSSRIGPIDLSRCPLAAYVDRRARAYRIPPLVTGIGEDLVRAMGDATARTTIDRYLAAGGRPMPTVMVSACVDALRYRLGCNWVGVAVGWSARSMRPFLHVITPDVLDVTYASDDPTSPTVIRWYRMVGDRQTVDISDLSDIEHPIYRIEDDSGVDVTVDILGEEQRGEEYWWRYEDGRPFHRVIVSGDPRQPYRGLPLVEGSLRVAVGYTGWWAGMRDAAYPSRHAIGLDLEGSATAEGTQGQEAGPEIVHSWRSSNPDRPGQLIQLGPGYDPEVTGRALRAYEQGLLAAAGLPVDYERTGGEPTATEQAEMLESIQDTYPACRGQDVLLLRRVAAVTNRAGDAEEAAGRARPYPPIPEGGYGVLYREEVVDLLERMRNDREKKQDDRRDPKPPEGDPESDADEDE